jgi:hypothetical protein
MSQWSRQDVKLRHILACDQIHTLRALSIYGSTASDEVIPTPGEGARRRRRSEYPLRRGGLPEAIVVTGRQAKRSDGKLPPHVMVYFAMALALFAEEDYEDQGASVAAEGHTPDAALVTVQHGWWGGARDVAKVDGSVGAAAGEASAVRAEYQRLDTVTHRLPCRRFQLFCALGLTKGRCSNLAVSVLGLACHGDRPVHAATGGWPVGWPGVSLARRGRRRRSARRGRCRRRVW